MHRKMVIFYWGIIVTFISSVVWCASGSQPANSESVKKVDTTFLAPITDIDFDGSKDTVVYHIQAPSWSSVVTFSISVQNKKKTIFSQTFLDSVTEHAFQGDVAIDFCENEDYKTCKKKWYCELLLKRVIIMVPLKESQRRLSLFDTANEVAMPRIFYTFYRDSLHISNQKAAVAIKESMDYFSSNDLTFFALPPHPVYMSFPSIFDPKSKKLIMIMGF
ncbi:MAG: hypothetical protein JW795_02365 [Chitinivibrionales bacterium]|nr:hypothetical protein [Chitinivibrionales bacterium]